MGSNYLNVPGMYIKDPKKYYLLSKAQKGLVLNNP
jgi:hypothetical protein